MIITNEDVLEKFCLKSSSDAAKQIHDWVYIAVNNDFKNSNDFFNYFNKGKLRVITGDILLFNIMRNDYRMYVKVNYARKMLTIVSLGRHDGEYKKLYKMDRKNCNRK